MKLVRWSFHNFQVPMMEDEEGHLWCTSAALCGALGLNKRTFQTIYLVHKDHFGDHTLRALDPSTKAFLVEHRDEFGVSRLRGDLRLWSDNDMLWFAAKSNSPAAREFVGELF